MSELVDRLEQANGGPIPPASSLVQCGHTFTPGAAQALGRCKLPSGHEMPHSTTPASSLCCDEHSKPKTCNYKYDEVHTRFCCNDCPDIQPAPASSLVAELLPDVGTCSHVPTGCDDCRVRHAADRIEELEHELDIAQQLLGLNRRRAEKAEAAADAEAAGHQQWRAVAQKAEADVVSWKAVAKLEKEFGDSLRAALEKIAGNTCESQGCHLIAEQALKGE